MRKFNKGDKVVLAHDAEFIHNGKKLPHNTEFTVVSVAEDPWGTGDCYELDNGAFIMPYWEDSFEKVAESKPMQKTRTVPKDTITVTANTDSRVTTARRVCGNEDIIRCAACGADDQYDEALGACIAVARTYDRDDIVESLWPLIKKREKPKGYTGRVVCTDVDISGSPFTVGRVYDVNDGYITVKNKAGSETRYKYQPENTGFQEKFVKFLEIVE